jgi:hypothetical protein
VTRARADLSHTGATARATATETSSNHAERPSGYTLREDSEGWHWRAWDGVRNLSGLCESEARAQGAATDAHRKLKDLNEKVGRP